MLKIKIINFLNSIKIFFLRRKLISLILSWYGLYEFVVRGPTKAKRIAFLYLLTHRNKKLRERLVGEIMSQPDCAALVKQRKRITIDFAYLATLPENTLGRKFYQHMMDNHIKLVVPTDAVLNSDYQYIIHRILISHDIYHALLEAPTTIYGEALVAAFTYSQISSYAPAFVHMAAGSLHCSVAAHGLIDRSNLGSVTGWLLGKSAKQLFSVNWDELWSKPIEQAQEQLNINLKKIENMIKDLYGNHELLQQKIPNIPTTISEHINDGTCVYKKIQDPKIDIYYPVNQPIRATVILGRAMFTTGKYLNKLNSPSLTACLVANGMQVIVPRVDKNSVINNFDEMLDLVDNHVNYAKLLQPNKPVYLIGHSLSGLCFLAHQGLTQKNKVSGVITLGVSTWHIANYSQEINLKLKYRIFLINYLLQALTKYSKRIPARLLGYGDYDEFSTMICQVTLENMQTGSWKSCDKKIDYYQVLKNISCPVLAVFSKQDEYAPPNQVKKFHQNIESNIEFLNADGLKHMELGASEKAWQTWEEISAWINKNL